MATLEGRERVITGAIESGNGKLILTGHTVLSDTYSHDFLELSAQVTSDIRSGFRYLVSVSRPGQGPKSSWSR